MSIQVVPDIEEGFTRAANDGHRHILLLAHNNALYATGSLYLTPTYISLSEIPIQQSGYTIIISYTRKKMLRRRCIELRRYAMFTSRPIRHNLKSEIATSCTADTRVGWSSRRLVTHRRYYGFGSFPYLILLCGPIALQSQ